MTTYGLLVLPGSEPALSDSAVPISGATLTVKIAGGSTLANIYADNAGVTPILNPQTSDAAGRFFSQSTTIWADSSQTYDCVLYYPSTGQTFTFSGVYTIGAPVNTSGFAPINSPNFTGVPTAPTPALNDNSQKIATTGYVQGQGFAPLNSPAFTGTPTAPTASAGTNTTQLATTAFVTAALGSTTPTSTSSGYVKFAGFIMQWTPFSIGSSPSATVSVTWPIAFPTAIIGQPWVAQTPGYTIGASSQSTTGATFYKNSADPASHTGTAYAIGY